MTEFRDMKGTVYILHNPEAGLVKVGMTTNSAGLRLTEFNDIWWGRKVTCQVCGRRLLNIGMRIKRHRGESRDCPGGNQLPLERDVSLAESHLRGLELRARGLSGSELGSTTRRIAKLKERIARYRDFAAPVGDWSISTTFSTESAERVELLSHELLEERSDRDAPFGEVFNCSPSEAVAAVETALGTLGLLQSARKETPEPPREYGWKSKTRPFQLTPPRGSKKILREGE
jgi:hypothetical protein